MALKKERVTSGFSPFVRDRRLCLPDRKIAADVASLRATDEDFDLAFLESVLRDDPAHEPALALAARLYVARGDYHRALDADRRLVRLRPDAPSAHYGLARSLSLVGDLDAAFRALDKAFQLGFGPVERAEEDPDLVNLRKDPRFALLKEKWRRAPSGG